MEANKTETQQKLEALAGYIDKQLSSGVNAKELYEFLLAKKVPANTAKSLIEQALKQRQPLSSTAAPAVDQKAERQQKIQKFVRAQLDAGKSPQEILKILVDKNVPKEEAIDLIRKTTKPSPSPSPSPQTDGSVSPDLPVSSIVTSTNRKNSPVGFIAAQLDQGVELKVIVDQLEAEGMPRNQAIDLVMNFNEKQKEEFAGPGFANRSELAIKGRNKMLIGLAALVGGGLFTIASYSAADAGGTYFLFYGPMIYGAIAAVSGFVQWTKNM